jgi:hypothetical protein
LAKGFQGMDGLNDAAALRAHFGSVGHLASIKAQNGSIGIAVRSSRCRHFWCWRPAMTRGTWTPARAAMPLDSCK